MLKIAIVDDVNCYTIKLLIVILPSDSSPDMSVCVLEHSKPSHFSVVERLNLKSKRDEKFHTLIPPKLGHLLYLGHCLGPQLH